MAYLSNIVRVSQDFEGLAWERYDAGQAAATGNQLWSRINGSLYAICFNACTARKRSRCELCLATTHTTKQCALQGNPDPKLDSRVKVVESVLVAMAPELIEPRAATSSDICRYFHVEMINYTITNYTVTMIEIVIIWCKVHC
jgi:hypothetical protein